MNTSYIAIIDEYGTWLDTLGYVPFHVYSSKFHLREFFGWLENKGIQSIDQLTGKHIANYQNYLETRPNKRSKGHFLCEMSLAHNFMTIEKLLQFLYQYGMKNVPVIVKRQLKINREEQILKIEPLTQQEIKTLYGCIPETYPSLTFEKRQTKQYGLKLIFALYYGCGLRRSEGWKLTLQDIDFDRKTVFVRQGKNYKDRIIPMSAGVYKELQDYVYNYRHRLRLEHNRLFVNAPNTLNDKLKYLQNYCDDEKIRAKRLSLHLLRHSIATHLLQNGMSIENISLFLGHNSLDTTQLYTHLI